MRSLLTLDTHNYDINLPELVRISVRGIIFVQGKLLLIEDDYDEVKLPGGGQEIGENDIQTLVREVKEETGYSVLPSTVIPFGKIEEKRMGTHEPMIWHQINRLYFCDVDPVQQEYSYSENEKKHHFHPIFYSIDEAIEKNLKMVQREGENPWNQREYRTLLIIKDFFESIEKVDMSMFSSNYQIKKITESEIDDALDVMQGNPFYFHHCPPAPSKELIMEDLAALPPRCTMKDKYYVGFYHEEQLLAVLDLIVGYPNIYTAFIGFFMMNSSFQNQHIGSKLIDELVHYLFSSGYLQIRLGYVSTNQQAKSFWEKNGFVPTGITAHQMMYDVVVMCRNKGLQNEND